MASHPISTQRLATASIVVAFGVNVGNLSRRAERRIPMEARVDVLNRKLARRATPVKVVAWYGHTGNLVVETIGISPAEAGDLLSSVDYVTWIGLSQDFLAHVASVMATRPLPEPEPRIRWTPGALFAVTRPTSEYKLPESRFAVYESFENIVVGAWKRDKVRPDGRLDSDRQGGWGALSNELRRATGPRWTARSLRTVHGILQIARQAGA